MNENTYEQLVRDHGRFPAVLAALVSDIDPAVLRERPERKRWSVLEVLAHLRDEEVEDFRTRAQAVAEGRPIERDIKPEAWVVERDYNGQDPGRVLGQLIVEREASCRWLRSLPRKALAKAIEHPKLGRMRCADFIAAWRMHDLLHLRQIATALARVEARRLEGHRLEYAGRLP
jgi:hypothetical protein